MVRVAASAATYVLPVLIVVFLSGCIPQLEKSDGIRLKGEVPYDGVLVIER